MDRHWAYEKFDELDGSEYQLMKDGPTFPCMHADVHHTPGGATYLRECGVVAIGRTVSHLDGIKQFLDGFDGDNGFGVYLKDEQIGYGERLAKFAGQLCYMSLGEQRTKNARSSEYFRNIKSSGHGSVLEHVSYSFLWYGLSRSMTHEAVRHRLASFSQVSQRYVGGNVLRFVERPEFQQSPELHARFLKKIEADAAYYEQTCDLLMERQGLDPLLSAEKKTEARKKVRQAARECLPNCTEAPMVVTMNVRSWRHFLDMRADTPAEVEIRQLAWKTFLCLAQMDPELFEDFAHQVLPDGTDGLRAEFRKV